MRSILRVMLACVVVALVGCASQKMAVKSANDKMVCKMACQQRLTACNQVCYKNCPTCTKVANASAARHYSQYKQEQCVQGGIIARDLKSYRDPLQCRKTTCNCWADYSVCVQACAGVIHKRLQIAPVCC